MSYQSSSVREAVEKINNTWYLPAIQRSYDWGERSKREQFIYKLFDSVFREYPVGSMIVWQTDKEIPFKRFLEDYDSEQFGKIEDKGKWNKEKGLVYDGQQRLQSLYSCLRFTFHGKVLCYNLLFDPSMNKKPEGFRFYQKQADLETGYIRLNEVFSCTRSRYELTKLEERVIEELKNKKEDLSEDDILLAKSNLKQLWKLFQDVDIKLLAFYSLHKDLEEKEVVDVFKRINSTGLELTNAEILFADLKRIKYDFEEHIWNACQNIKKQTGNGISFTPENVLQLLHLIVKGAIRVDPERVSEPDLKEFVSVWSDLRPPLTSFFFDFLYGEFKITHEKILASKQALLPLITYFYYMDTKEGREWKDFSATSINNMKKFLIYSQLLDWDLQGFIDNFHRKIKYYVEKKGKCDFPFGRLRSFILNSGRRDADLRINDFNTGLPWFVLKILDPNRAFSFTGNPNERFDPEIDHIFPENPEPGTYHSSEYFEVVQDVWNMQPVKGEINNLKLGSPPSAFFKKYPKYLKEYDCLPSLNPNDSIWLDKHAPDFIEIRKKKMISKLRKTYFIPIRKS